MHGHANLTQNGDEGKGVPNDGEPERDVEADEAEDVPIDILAPLVVGDVVANPAPKAGVAVHLEGLGNHGEDEGGAPHIRVEVGLEGLRVSAVANDGAVEHEGDDGGPEEGGDAEELHEPRLDDASGGGLAGVPSEEGADAVHHILFGCIFERKS